MQKKLSVGSEKYADPNFFKSLDKSEVARHIIAKRLIEKGYEVEVPELKVTPGWKERLAYSDNGDLFLLQDGKRERIEVKHWPKINFTSKEDIRYDNIIVNAVNSWDNADIKPSVHYILNANYTHVIIIDSRTREHWYRARTYDSRKKQDRSFYFCPKKYINVKKL